MIRRTSYAGWFDICETANVLWFGYMEETVCNRDDLILNPLFNFKPMKILEYLDDVKIFGSASNGATCVKQVEQAAGMVSDLGQNVW